MPGVSQDSGMSTLRPMGLVETTPNARQPSCCIQLLKYIYSKYFAPSRADLIVPTFKGATCRQALLWMRSLLACLSRVCACVASQAGLADYVVGRVPPSVATAM